MTICKRLIKIVIQNYVALKFVFAFSKSKKLN